MGFMDDVLAERTSKGPTCAMGLSLEDMDDKFRVEVLEALADRSIPATWVGAALRKNGLSVSNGAVQRHRSQRCSCPQ